MTDYQTRSFARARQLVLLLLLIPSVVWGFGRSLIFGEINFGETTSGATQDEMPQGDSDSNSKRVEANAEGKTLKDCATENPNDGLSQTGDQTESTNAVLSSDSTPSKGTAAQTVSDGVALEDDSNRSDSNENNVAGRDGNESSGVANGDNQANSAPAEQNSNSATYNSVNVKKPSIPDTFRTPNNEQNNAASNSSVSVYQLMGIPMLLFCSLFFLMWGIISGKIQRLMF